MVPRKLFRSWSSNLLIGKTSVGRILSLLPLSTSLLHLALSMTLPFLKPSPPLASETPFSPGFRPTFIIVFHRLLFLCPAFQYLLLQWTENFFRERIMLLISVSPVQVTMLDIEWVFNKDLFSECMTSRIIFSEEQTEHSQPILEALGTHCCILATWVNNTFIVEKLENTNSQEKKIKSSIDPLPRQIITSHLLT